MVTIRASSYEMNVQTITLFKEVSLLFGVVVMSCYFSLAGVGNITASAILVNDLIAKVLCSIRHRGL